MLSREVCGLDSSLSGGKVVTVGRRNEGTHGLLSSAERGDIVPVAVRGRRNVDDFDLRRPLVDLGRFGFGQYFHPGYFRSCSIFAARARSSKGSLSDGLSARHASPASVVKCFWGVLFESGASVLLDLK